MQQTSMQVFDRLFLDHGLNSVSVDTMISDTIAFRGNQVGVALSVINSSGTFSAGFPALLLLGTEAIHCSRPLLVLLTIIAS